MTTPFENGDPWQDRLSEYLDGLLTEADMRALEEHLATCESCRTALAELRAVLVRLKADRMDEAPEDEWPRIASRLPTRTLQDARAARGNLRASLGVQTATLRKITAAAVLTLTFVGGVWAGVSLCLAESAWTPPGWMHLKMRASQRASRGVNRTTPPLPADSILDEWTSLRRSISALDQQLVDATSALEKEPGNRALQRLVLRLTIERDNLRSLLDSAVRGHRPSQ
jgi:Putative zinc-finger